MSPFITMVDFPVAAALNANAARARLIRIKLASDPTRAPCDNNARRPNEPVGGMYLVTAYPLVKGARFLELRRGKGRLANRAGQDDRGC